MGHPAGAPFLFLPSRERCQGAVSYVTQTNNQKQRRSTRLFKSCGRRDAAHCLSSCCISGSSMVSPITASRFTQVLWLNINSVKLTQE